MKKYYFLVLFCFVLATSFAQVGVNTTTPNAMLEIRTSNEAAPTPTDGLLIPKVNVFPATNPTIAQQGMLVYLTTLVGTNQPGFYFWDFATLAWRPIAGATAAGTLDQAYDFGGAGLGRTITADNGAVLINGTDGLVSTGTINAGAIAPSGFGTKMFWNPRKAAIRAGGVNGAQWDDANIGTYSTAFGNGVTASAFTSTAFGNRTTASGFTSTAFGTDTRASGTFSTAFGVATTASGGSSTAFGEGTTAFGGESTAFGEGTSAFGRVSSAFGAFTEAIGDFSTAFGRQNFSRSYGETALGIGATIYTPSTSGATEFRTANSIDRLFVIGNAIDADNDNFVDLAERSDAIIILKNGLTRLPSTTNAMITAADGKAVVTKEYLESIALGSLDQAYDFGGAGLGRTITADAGAVTITGNDGFVSTGTFGSGALAPTGLGVKMFWNPRKAAFRAGHLNFNSTSWDDINIGNRSTAFGNSTTASGGTSVAFGEGTVASGLISTAFGSFTTASGVCSTAFGLSTQAIGDFSMAFGRQNFSRSYGETALGIGATIYTPSTTGGILFMPGNSTDRLFVIGNAIDANQNNFVDLSERSDAIIILKNGLTRLPSTTNAMITAADGKAVVTKEYLQNNTSGTLDQAYNFGGAGLGNTITADAGAVTIAGNDGFVSTGTFDAGAIAPSGAGVKMFWNPRKAAFRAGRVTGTDWDDANVGGRSTAFGFNTTASGNVSTAFGFVTTASGIESTAFGSLTTASGNVSTAFGSNTIASGFRSTAFGFNNGAPSYGETALGIGATIYTPSTNGATEFRTANSTDRLFVIGNAIDVDNDNFMDFSERSDAIIILKNGLTRLPSTTNAMITAADGKAVVTKEYLAGNSWSLTGNSGTNTTNFIGTTDNVDVIFRRNSLISGRIGVTNTSFGLNAFDSNTTGTANTATGFSALKANTTGVNNTANGYTSLSANTEGNNNTAIGFEALLSNVDGDNNTAVGVLALQDNTIGIDNTATGRSSLRANTSGNSNTAFGRDALFNSTGSNNTAVGRGTLSGVTTGTNNTAIGFNAQVANATASNQVRVGSAVVTLASVQVGWTITSDNRWKSNIQPSNLGLEFVKQLNPVFYTRKDVEINDGKTTILETTTNPITEYGFIAQELESTLNKFDTSNNGIINKDDDGMYGVRYNDLIAPLVKAIQEQQAIIEALNMRIEKLENK